MSEVGAYALNLALIVALYTVGAALYGAWRRSSSAAASASNGVYVVFALTSVAAIGLGYGLVTRDFSLQYVAHYSSRDLPLFYTLTAFWAGQSGSLLLWTWLLAAFAAIVQVQGRHKDRALVQAATGILVGIQVFFLYLVVHLSSPFERLPFTAADGGGLNPMLQNPGMVIHPPMLYLGFVGFTIPFAFAMAALVTKRLDAGWIRTTRRWTLLAWLGLTLGNLFGAQWAYEELGWGGYWAWDPVENASLMPWLTGTAFLHSVMIQEKRGMLKTWNLVLIILTYALIIFGTFITRSGIIASVHSFGVSDLGPAFLVYLIVLLVVSVGFVLARQPMLVSRHQLESFLSREASFLVNNLLLLGLAFATFWGTIFPFVSEAVTGNKVTVGPPFFDQVNTPIGLALLALTGVCPLLAWRRSAGENLRRNFLIPGGVGVVAGIWLLLAGYRQGMALLALSLAAFVTATIAIEFYRGMRARKQSAGVGSARALAGAVGHNRRRYGGYIVHLGVVLVAAGIAGSSFNEQVRLQLSVGEAGLAGGYGLTYNGPVEYTERNKSVLAAELELSRDGQTIGYLRPERAYYPKHEQAVSEVAIHGGLWEDVYVVLGNISEGGEAFVQVHINPLVGWIWVGGWVMVVGTLVAIWPEKGRARVQNSVPNVQRTGAKSPRRVAAAVTAALMALAWPAPSTAITADEISAHLACSCGCGMTAANCTHEGCTAAATMKSRVAKMVSQGRSKEEILDVFVAQFGDGVLAAPPKRGFSLTAWTLPFVAIAGGGVALYGLLARWTAREGGSVEEARRPHDDAFRERVRRDLVDLDDRGERA